MMKCRKRMKKDVVPHKFECQEGRKRTVPQPEITAALKKRREQIVAECLDPGPSTSTAFTAIQEEEIESDPEVSDEPLQKDIGVQVHIKPHFRSKGVQCTIVTPTLSQSCSPMSIKKKDVALTPIKSHLFKRKLPFMSSESSENVTSGSSSSSPSEHHTTETGESTEYEDVAELEIKKKIAAQHTKFIIERNPRRYLGILKESIFLINELSKFTSLDTTSIYLTLKKIRLDQTFAELADDFGMSESTASRIFSKAVILLSGILADLVTWPPAEKIKKLLPLPFRARYKNVQAIIDCLEIEINKPEDAVKQALTWSEYKKTNTMKYLISSTPDGIINYISTGFGGRASDALIVEQSSFLDILPPAVHIMADRGFKHIERLLKNKNCVLIRPPSVETGTKMNKEQAAETKRIASLRIHIERIIRRVREFKMLRPHSCLNLKLVPNLDHIIIIACALVNTQGPLIN